MVILRYSFRKTLCRGMAWLPFQKVLPDSIFWRGGEFRSFFMLPAKGFIELKQGIVHNASTLVVVVVVTVVVRFNFLKINCKTIITTLGLRVMEITKI